MRIALFTNILSPHQLPLANEIVKRIGEDSYRYIYTQPLHDERVNMGWSEKAPNWTEYGDEHSHVLEETDLLIICNRAINLIESRLQQHKKTIYCSERWFKPWLGMGRLLSPKFLRMAYKIMTFMKSNDFMYFPMGIHAAADFIQLHNLLSGKFSALLKRPVLAFESYPGGKIVSLKMALQEGVINQSDCELAKKQGFIQIPREYWGKCIPKGMYSKMRVWGYFVAPTVNSQTPKILRAEQRKKILWVGRMLPWKNVETLVRAVKRLKKSSCNEYELHLYGKGIDENKLKHLATDCDYIHFHSFVPVQEVRNVMRQHDIYVLPSNAYEGWGAVVNEALEEGMHVFASTESGSGATILPSNTIFHTDDDAYLAELLKKSDGAVGIQEWNPEFAAKFLLDFMNGNK